MTCCEFLYLRLAVERKPLAIKISVLVPLIFNSKINRGLRFNCWTNSLKPKYIFFVVLAHGIRRESFGNCVSRTTSHWMGCTNIPFFSTPRDSKPWPLEPHVLVWLLLVLWVIIDLLYCSYCVWFIACRIIRCFRLTKN